MNEKKRVYLASPWFSEVQSAEERDLARIIRECGLDLHSPREDVVVSPGASALERITAFNSNIMGLHNVDLVIVNTRDKDMGSIFEAGYAYALHWNYEVLRAAGMVDERIQIVYYAYGLSGKFNLMLAQSGCAVLTSPDDLRDWLTIYARDPNALVDRAYGGLVE